MHTFQWNRLEFWRQSKLKRREFTFNRCYQSLYACTMYFQGRRNTCNMLRSLKQKQRKVWTSSHKIYQAKLFCCVRYQNVTKLCPPFARFIHHFPIFIFPRLPLANISLQYKLLGTRSRPMDTQCALSYFSKKMFVEAALSNVNDSFTLGRLMKQPKTFCDP